MANRWGNNGNGERLYFLGSKITADGDYSREIKTFAPWEKVMTNLDNILKSRDITLPTKACLIMDFPVVMYGCVSWTIRTKLNTTNWCFWTVVLDKTLESPLDCKEIQPVNPKGNQSWIFIGRTDADAETPIFWPPDVKKCLTRKDPDAGKDWKQEEKGMTEYDFVGWHYWLNGHESDKALGVGDGQGSLACCSPWLLQRVGHNWATEMNW